MNAGSAHASKRYGQGDPQAGSLPEKPAQEQNRRQAEQHGSESRDCLQTVPAMEQRKSNIGQPFPGKPRLAGSRERKQIANRDGTRAQDEIARANMPSGIAVMQQSLPGGRPAKSSQEQHWKEEIR